MSDLCPITNAPCTKAKVILILEGGILCCKECDAFTQILSVNKPPIVSCTNCGSTPMSIAKTQKIGCPHCYTDMKSFVEPLVGKVQEGTSIHVGKQPGSKPIKALEEEMALAVSEQRYEDAAKIRDKINSLKS
jgi:protein-arginine kinase activator protein McsA